MTATATKAKRNVVVALQTMETASRMSATEVVETPRVKRICAIFSDRQHITEGLYSGNDEALLLRSFWRDIRPNDRIFSANVLNDMSLVRARTWQLGVLPSLEIDLRCVYGLEMWDTVKMWAADYIPYVPYVRCQSSRSPRQAGLVDHQAV